MAATRTLQGISVPPERRTPATRMRGQLSRALKEARARELIALGEQVSRAYMQTWIGETAPLLVEEETEGCWGGYTPEYLRVTLPPGVSCRSGDILPVRLTGLTDSGLSGVPAAE